MDVRPRGHYDIVRVKKSINAPYDSLQQMDEGQLTDLLGDKQKPLLISCKTGVTSKRAANFLIQHGYNNVLNVEGGINKYGKLYDSGIVNL